MEMRITFLYEKQFQEMAPFSKDLIELYNLASSIPYKLYAQKQFFRHVSFMRGHFLKIKISVSFLNDKQFQE